jgi:predicted secreted protein
VALAAAVAVASIGIASAQTAQPPAATSGQTMILSLKDNDQVIYVAPGTTVQVTLPENMSTGYGWQVEPINGTDVQVVSDTHTDFQNKPGTDGQRVIVLQAGQSGSANIWIDKVRGHTKVDNFFIQLKIGAVPATMQEAAKMFVEDDMRSDCELNHIPGGKVDHVYMEGNYVLGDWSCGHMRGEITFEMRGTAMIAKTVSTAGEDADVRLSLEQITHFGADQATAQKLIDQRDRQSH